MNNLLLTCHRPLLEYIGEAIGQLCDSCEPTPEEIADALVKHTIPQPLRELIGTQKSLVEWLEHTSAISSRQAEALRQFLATGEIGESASGQPCEGQLLLEASPRVIRFTYERAKHDPHPRLFVLGRWRHPNGNILLLGINLNYLNEDELRALAKHAKAITKPNNPKDRWWTGFTLLPEIWLKAYRQYDERFIHDAHIADFPPEIKDYEEPVEPGEHLSDAELVRRVLRAYEAYKTRKPPRTADDRVARLSRDTLTRVANLIKSQLASGKIKPSDMAPEVLEVMNKILSGPETGEAEAAEATEENRLPDRVAMAHYRRRPDLEQCLIELLEA